MTRREAIKALKWFKEYNEEDYGAGDRIIDKYGDCYYRVTERDFEAFDMAIKALEQEPILEKVKQAREEIENEVKFWSEPSKYNEESLAYVRKAKARSYKHCLEILDKLIESEG
jgi:hypothetical protein